MNQKWRTKRKYTQIHNYSWGLQNTSIVSRTVENQGLEDLNIIAQFYLINIHKVFHPTTEYTFLSVHGTFTKVDQGSANYDLQAKFNLPSVFINKV